MAAVVVFFLNATALMAQPHLAGFNDEEITWFGLSEGIAEAQASGRPVFLLIHATWCPTCQTYRGVFDDPDVVSMASKMVFVLVDRDKEPQASAAYAPDGEYIPRSMVLDPDGTLRSDLNSGREDYAHFLDPSDPRHLLSVLNAALK